MSDPKLANPALVLAQTWNDQLLLKYMQVTEELALAALVGSSLAARDADPDAVYAEFTLSDQGPYYYFSGAADADKNTTVDSEDESLGYWDLRERELGTWAPFAVLDSPRYRGAVIWVDIAKVLAEVPVPWKVVSAPTAKVNDTAECERCGGDIEYDGVEWWHSRIEAFEHVARPRNGD